MKEQILTFFINYGHVIVFVILEMILIPILKKTIIKRVTKKIEQVEPTEQLKEVNKELKEIKREILEMRGKVK